MDKRLTELMNQDGFMGRVFYECELAQREAEQKALFEAMWPKPTWRDPLELLCSMAAIEGDDWADYQLEIWNEAERYTALGPCIEHMVAVERRYGEDADVTYFRNLKAVAIVYGDGGWHRYYLNGDGSVSFSRQHAFRQAALSAAISKQFTIV